MAVVGEAHVIVRAITSKVADDIRKGFSGLDQTVASRAGDKIGRSFSQGYRRSGATDVFGKTADGLRALVPDAEASRLAFRKLVKGGYVLNTALGVLAGGIGSLGSGLLSLISAAGAAAQGLGVVIGSFIQLRIAAFTASFALKGISQAVAQATGASSSYGKTVKELREELQQLQFDSQDAALGEERAALNLEKAREALMRVQDLPPNSRARREAELAYKEADLAYQKAMDRNADLQDQLVNGVPASSANDPYAGLTESQKKFAEFLVGIKPEIDKLREAVAAAFLGPLETQITRIVDNVFPMLEDKLPIVAAAFGVAAEKFTDAIVKQENIDQLGRVLEGMAPSIENWGTIFGNIYEIALDIAEALNPVVELFTNDLIKKTDEWKQKIDDLNKSGELTAIFERGYDVLKKFGEIAGNVLGGIGNSIDLNFGENGSGGGWVILNWLDTVTEKFKNLGGDTEQSRADMAKFFEDSATNATLILDAIGAYLKEVMKLADNPAIAETFSIIKEAAPQFGELLRKGLEAGPSFAELVVNLIDLGNALQDTGAMKIFFTTLSEIVKQVADFMKSELGQQIFQITGRIFAFGLAIGAAFGPIKFLFKAIIGNAIFLFSAFSKIGGALKVLGPWLRVLGTLLTGFGKTFFAIGKLIFTVITGIGRLLLGILGPWGIAITAVVGLLVWFFTQTDVGKKMWSDFMDWMKGMLDGLVGFFQNFDENMANIWNGITTWWNDSISSVGQWFEDVWNGIVSFFKGIGDGIAGFWKTIVDKINERITAVRDTFKLIFDKIKTIASDIWTGIKDAWDGAVEKIKTGIGNVKSGFETVFGQIKSTVKTIINTMIGYAEGFINFWIRGLNNIIGLINGLKFKVPDFVPVWGGKSVGFNLPKFSEITLPRLAKGGIVMPSAGGSIVNVAEAGRPERIEPLDPDGLSKRDKAMIQELVGMGGSGININVYAAPGMSEKELAQAVSRELAFKIRRGGI